MVPDVYKWGSKLRLAALLAGFAAVQGAVQGGFFAAAAQERDLTRVVYDFAVTSYCGTLDPEVEAGFRAELAALTARGGFDEETARRQRIRGWVQADEEWRNRGLGGFRAWCRSEGLAAARHFQAIARGQRRP